MGLSTKDKLAWTAAKLFQENGFNGVGLSEILKAADVPKGSLYHHFPEGKPSLALAAAELAHRETTRIINEAFLHAEDFEKGVTNLCYKFAKLSELFDNNTGCPISQILFTGPNNEDFRRRTSRYFDEWMSQLASYSKQFGKSEEEAKREAQRIFVGLQGAWTLSRTTRSAEILKKLPALLFEQ